MKKICGWLVAIVVVVSMGSNAVLMAKEKRERVKKQRKEYTIIKETGQFDVYTDKLSRLNHYIPSGYMGDYGDIKVNDNCTDQPRAGKACIRIEYLPRATQGAKWVGIYWQNPANNWGTINGGYDLSGAQRLTFWARGEKGGEFVSEFKVGGITGEYADSDSVSITDIELTKNWKRYEIDLSKADMSSISGGFCWSANLDNNPDGFIVYLDEVIYEFQKEKKAKQKKEEDIKKPK